MQTARRNAPLPPGYHQLLQTLAARGLEWIRQQVEDLPDPLPPAHAALAPLAASGRMAPVLSSLRGRRSPLEVIVARRLTADMVLEAASRVFDDRQGRKAQADLLLAGADLLGTHPLWQLACDHLAEDASVDLADRLALGAPLQDVLPEAEAKLIAHIPDEVLGEKWIDSFARLLMQVYAFGTRRPEFSSPRIYGQIFDNCLRHAEWAQKSASLPALAQMAFCLRLIDPDHDIVPLLAELIPFQRPDGSFPPRCGYSDADQDFATGFRPTLLAVAALHQSDVRFGQRTDNASPSRTPLHSGRDKAAAILSQEVLAALADLPAETRLHAAAALSRATGQNWFEKTGLAGYQPTPAQILPLAQQVFGGFGAARHARNSLSLARTLPQYGQTQAQHDRQAIHWLRGKPVNLAQPLPARLHHDWKQTAQARDTDRFMQCCQIAATCQPGIGCQIIRTAARQIAQTDLRALAQQGHEPIEKRLDRLDRLSLLALLFEPQIWLQTAA